MDDLAGVNRALTPWLVLMWHTPFYNSNSHHQLEAEPMRVAIEERLVRAGVNLVISGHVHSYERSHPVRNFTLDECGPMHVVVGDGGNYEGPALPWHDEQPEWSAFREASYGTARLEIQSSTKAVFKWTRQACVRRKSGMFNVWSHENDATYYVPQGGGGGDGDAGPCATEDDNSETRHVTVDEVLIRQHPARCRGEHRSTAAAVETSK
jgi:3',5'-cyclic AMP phosphodiesterase CpdA